MTHHQHTVGELFSGPPLLRVHIPLAPVAKARPRVTSRGTFTPKKTRAFERAAAQFIRAAMTDQGVPCFLKHQPIQMMVTFVLKRPQRLKGTGRVPHTRRPDADNLLKAIKDAADKVVVTDDGQIWRCLSEKYYAAQGEDPCIELAFWRGQ